MMNLDEFSGHTGLETGLHETASFLSGSHEENPDSNTRPKSVYQCPMKCEGDKTYNAPGNCPVCNMHLEPVIEIHEH